MFTKRQAAGNRTLRRSRPGDLSLPRPLADRTSRNGASGRAGRIFQPIKGISHCHSRALCEKAGCEYCPACNACPNRIPLSPN